VLESVRTRVFEVVELSDSLDGEARERLLRRWEAEPADYTSAFIGRSLTTRGSVDLISSLSGTA
jgi:hypothetical protein